MKPQGIEVKTVPLKIRIDGKRIKDAIVLQALTGAARSLLTDRALKELFKRAWIIAGGIESGEFTDEN